MPVSTVRTIWRDLHALQEAGFPIYDERDGLSQVDEDAGNRRGP